MPKTANEELSSQAKIEYNSIDLFKFVMALCVVAIHTNPMVNCSDSFLNRLYENMVNSAVPFFFLSSGYLLAKRIGWPYNQLSGLSHKQTGTIIYVYIYKILRLYLLWSLVYLPVAVIGYARAGFSIIDGTMLYLRRFLFFGGQINSEFLWYLLSTIYAMLLIAFCLKKHISPCGITIICLVIILVSIGLDVFTGYESVFGLESLAPILGRSLTNLVEHIAKFISVTVEDGRIFRGAFYIPVGMLLANKNMLLRSNVLVLCTCFIASCLIDSFVFRSCMQVVISVTLFQVLLSVRLNSSCVYPFLRKMSKIIYFLHMYVLILLRALGWIEKGAGVKCFVATAFITIVISFIFSIIDSKKKASV
ncbi:MAG: hypothetical protein J6J19_08360 [Oscillospiraceae bacterium]|nr:hypothetical protein [Oscillospiraceae bacterium]